jgi:pimeloyl-ACP methyl ester carboxylesterase
MTLQLFWDRAGTGEPLLLLHGIGSTHDDFVALRPRLDARYRVLAPDLPGHGRSSALPGRPTVAAIADAITTDLDELGVGRVHVLGNSIGAASRSSWPPANGPARLWRSPHPGSTPRPSGSIRAR